MPIQMLSECFATAFPRLHSTSKRSLRKGFLSSTEAGGTSYQQQLISDSLRDGFEAMFLFFDFLDFRYLETRILVVKNGVLVDVCVLKSWKTDSTWAVSPKHPVWGNTFCKNRGIRSQHPPQNISKHAPQVRKRRVQTVKHTAVSTWIDWTWRGPSDHQRCRVHRPSSAEAQHSQAERLELVVEGSRNSIISSYRVLTVQFFLFHVSSESNLFESHLPAWQPEVPLKVSGHGREINSPCSLVCAFFPFFRCSCYSCGFDGGCGCGGGRCPSQLPYCTTRHSHYFSMALDACFNHVCAPTSPKNPEKQ